MPHALTAFTLIVPHTQLIQRALQILIQHTPPPSKNNARFQTYALIAFTLAMPYSQLIQRVLQILIQHPPPPSDGSLYLGPSSSGVTRLAKSAACKYH